MGFQCTPVRTVTALQGGGSSYIIMSLRNFDLVRTPPHQYQGPVGKI